MPINGVSNVNFGSFQQPVNNAMQNAQALGSQAAQAAQNGFNQVSTNLNNFANDSLKLMTTGDTSVIPAVGSVLGKGVAGAVVAQSHAGTVATLLTEAGTGISGAFKGGLGGIRAALPAALEWGKGFLNTMGRATGLSALISGGISAVSNTIGVLAGRVTGRDAVGNVAADTTSGAVSGIGAAFSSAGAVMIASAFTPLAPLTVPLAIGAGVLGAIGSDQLFKVSGAYNWVKEKVSSLFD